MNGKKALRDLIAAGWIVVSRTKRHIVLRKDGKLFTLSHGKLQYRAQRTVMRACQGRANARDTR